MRLRSLLRVLVLLVFALCRRAYAETLQAPIGGKGIALGTARVACGAPEGGWTLDSTGRLLRPPTQDDAVGKVVELKIAETVAGCRESTTVLRLVATGAWPTFDPNSVVLSADQNTVEVRGRRLRGVGLAWRSDTASGIDICSAPKLDPNAERCQWAVGRGLSADPNAGALQWVPAGARVGPDIVTFDSDGNRADPNTFVLTPARVVVNALLPPDASIDLSTGRGEVPLVHPEAIDTADCNPVHCEVHGG
ncbi:MAG TPA: hypothetical protein VFQ35_11595, partial [Polyangiaceae bacterium]|nr:hypothetical protein [Polyangiaceae bacterium]